MGMRWQKLGQVLSWLQAEGKKALPAQTQKGQAPILLSRRREESLVLPVVIGVTHKKDLQKRVSRQGRLSLTARDEGHVEMSWAVEQGSDYGKGLNISFGARLSNNDPQMYRRAHSKDKARL
ncbi:hypothetical protein SRHO_G00172690 [Serrasalmus rhombeus]